jgi:hypothetical protein
MAVQITVLRLFLSLVQEIRPTKSLKDNFGIEPLPNLDYKFAVADTLTDISVNDLFFHAHREEFEQILLLKADFFRETLTIPKKELRQRIAITEQKLAEKSENRHIKALCKWNHSDSVPAPYFDPRWVFGVEKFHFVIGNPPYVEHKKLKKRAAALKGKYKVFSGTADLSVYFIERGLNLCKETGLLMYIITNKFFSTHYGKPVRSLILQHRIHTLINFEQVEVFENTLVSSVILGIQPKPDSGSEFRYCQFSRLKRKEFYKQFAEIQNRPETFSQSQLGKAEWSFADAVQTALKKKIEKHGKPLGSVVGVAVYRGVTTGCNPAFIIDAETKERLISEDTDSRKLIKPLLQGRNIRKWIYNDSKTFLIFTRQGVCIEDYPSIKKHLLSFKRMLTPGGKGGRKKGDYCWYEIQDITAYYSKFEKEKIIWGLTADKWAFAYDDRKHYLPSNGYMLTSDNVPVKYLLGLLNSKVLRYYFGFIGVMTAGGAFTLKHSTIVQLPVVLAEDMQPLIDLVNRRLRGDAKAEKEIDLLVYKLYGLTEEERKIIERSYE